MEHDNKKKIFIKSAYLSTNKARKNIFIYMNNINNHYDQIIKNKYIFQN